MTSRSRRKPRTTAPRTWGPRTACSLALAALCGGPAAAQQPPTVSRPAAVYATPYPTTAGQPGGVPNGGAARPWTPYQSAAAQQPRQQQPQQPAPQPTATTGRPDTGPPAGYRPVSGGAQQPTPRAERVGAAGGAGQVMYFRKPADALAVDGMADPGAVVQAQAPPVLAPAATGVPVAVPGVPPPLPTAVPARPALATPPLPLGVPVPVVQEQPPVQPDAQPKGDAQPDAQPKGDAQPSPGPFLAPEVTQLPPRDKIFLMYDDAALHRAIIERAKEDARRRADKKDVPKLEGNWDFPSLPPVVPPGTQFVSRTGTFAPQQALYEPGFVVHRRLHFEERNSERYGWDLGFATPFVSAAYFYKDVLLWPNSLASGVVTGFWDTNAGKCLPGSPTPYYLYPPGLTITGTTTEALVVTGASLVLVP
ncbi:hypothetical protein J0H58_36835 [bacterium]|nr:hypothetical protein [bacterium]